MSDTKGSIWLQIEPSPPQGVLERYRRIFAALIESDSLNIRNGSVQLHFDHNGILRRIDSYSCRWRDKYAEEFLTQESQGTMMVASTGLLEPNVSLTSK